MKFPSVMIHWLMYVDQDVTHIIVFVMNALVTSGDLPIEITHNVIKKKKNLTYNITWLFNGYCN